MAPSLSICLRTQTRVTLVTLTRLARELAEELVAVPATVAKIARPLRSTNTEYGVAIVFRLTLFPFATPYFNIRI